MKNNLEVIEAEATSIEVNVDPTPNGTKVEIQSFDSQPHMMPANYNSGLTIEEYNQMSAILKAGEVKNTEKTYTNAMRQFQKHGFTIPTTPEQLLKFCLILQRNKAKPSTISTYVNSIAIFQKDLGFCDPISPDVKKLISAYKKINPSTSLKGERYETHEILMVCQSLLKNGSEKGKRDRVLFLTALWTCARTDELARFSYENTRLTSTDITFSVQGAKNFQHEELGKTIPKLWKGDDNTLLKSLCTHDAYCQYVDILEEKEGLLFRRLKRGGKIANRGISERSVGKLIKEILIENGIDSERAAKINGHSFRHTLADIASQLNMGDQAIKKLGGWKSSDSISTYTGDHRTNTIKGIAESMTDS